MGREFIRTHRAWAGENQKKKLRGVLDANKSVGVDLAVVPRRNYELWARGKKGKSSGYSWGGRTGIHGLHPLTNVSRTQQ